MADEEAPINPNSTRDRRRRRNRSGSNSEDNKKGPSSSNVLMPSSSREPLNHGSGHENGGVVSEKDNSMRKKRPSRRHTPEPDMSEDSKENLTPGRSERRRQRRPQHAQRMPRSVSEEVLALEGKFHPQMEQETAAKPPQGKRNRRTRRKDLEQGDDASEDHPIGIPENQVVDRHPPRSRIRGNQPKKKRRVRSAMLTSGDEENYQGDMDGEVSEIFKVDKEDIIQSDLSQSTGKMAQVNATTLPSQPLDFLFIEKRDGQGFVKEHKSKVDGVNEEQNEMAQDVLHQNERQATSMEFALQIHKAFCTIALICHGLLAGITLTQCIFVYSLSESSYQNLLANYHTLALPFQAVYYFLLAICIVSVFDRYVNVSVGWSQFFLALLSRPSRALAIVGYLFALVFSVSLAQLDDKIGLYKVDPSLWTSTTQLPTWRVINLIRVVGAILGWISVSLNPMDDQASKNISSIIEQDRAESKSNTRLKSGTIASWEQQDVA